MKENRGLHNEVLLRVECEINQTQIPLDRVQDGGLGVTSTNDSCVPPVAPAPEPTEFTTAYVDESIQFLYEPSVGQRLSGVNDALDPSGSDAPLDCPLTDVLQSNAIPVTGQKANRHTVQDNNDILYCYIWGHRKAKILHGGYTKHMVKKWNLKRADKPMSKSALATKGKRLYDRAAKNLGGKGWLHLDDLERIQSVVDAELGAGVPAGENEY